MQIIGFILHYKNVLTLVEELKYDKITDIDRTENPEEFIAELTKYFNIYSTISWSKEALDDYLYNLAKELYRKSGLTNGPKYPEIKEKNKRKLQIKQWHLDTYFKYRIETASVLQKLDAIKQIRNRFIHSNNDPIIVENTTKIIASEKTETANAQQHYDGKTKKYYEDYYKSGSDLLLEMSKENLNQFMTEYEVFVLKMLTHPSNKNAYVEQFEQKIPYFIED